MITAALALLRETARASFWQNYEMTPDIMEGIFQRVDSNSDQETYPGLSYAPSPREMTGGRSHRSIPSFEYTVKNRAWESTVDIAYALWRFGKLGAVQSMLASMGQKARQYPSVLTATLINTGDATAGHDAQFFYSASHVDPGAKYSTAQDNDLTSNIGDTAAATVLEMYSTLQAHRAQYDTFKDGEGDPVVPDENARFIVLCPGGHMPAARAVFKNDQITGPIANDMKGVFEPRLNPYADSTAEIFTFWASGVRKAFIYQVADAVTLEDNIGGDSEFETKDVSFGSFGFYNVGYGDWRYSIRHIFT
jgi:phage major head subunit gpT-like protein